MWLKIGERAERTFRETDCRNGVQETLPLWKPRRNTKKPGNHKEQEHADYAAQQVSQHVEQTKATPIEMVPAFF